jgi:histidyl-tRNA synthetase
MSSAQPSLNPTRGMRDFYPADMAVRNHIFDAWRAASEHYGFQPYDAPVVESLDLLKRKSGEEIVNQIYAFNDKSGRELALRAEMTPTLARMVAAQMGSLTLPIKWFTIAQCFRYERMTRGRKREHFQLNLDVIGESELTAEVEVIATALHSLTLMGLPPEKVRVRYNSRLLLSELLQFTGVLPEHHAATFLVLDKRGKITEAQITELLTDAGLPAEQIEATMAVMRVETLSEAEAMLGPDAPAIAQISRFNHLLAQYGLEDRVSFDISVIRGLSYYTGIVFEAFDTERSFRAIFGGGRYDNLLQDVGGKAATGVGLGFGDVVIADLLTELGCMDATPAAAEVLIGYMQAEQTESAMRTANHFRNEGLTVDLALHAEKPKSFFGRAGKRPYRKAIYIGPDDVAKATIRLKDLNTREESEIPLPA